MRKPTSARTIASYEIIGEISRGSYGVVCKARAIASREPSAAEQRRSFYAIKKVKAVDSGEAVSSTSLSTLREIKVLKELRHPHVVRLIDVVLDGSTSNIALVFEYAELELGYLIRHHHRGRSRIPPTTVKSIMKQLLDALRYLHANWIVHRDVKPQNVLIIGSGEQRGTVKLADFGLALVSRGAVVKPLPSEGPVVTLWYRAPELLLGAQSYTTGVDLWALGCVFGEMMICEPLFRGEKEDALSAEASGGFERAQCHEIFKYLGHPTPSTWDGARTLKHWPHVQQWQSSERVHSLQRLVCRTTDGAFSLLQRLLALDPATRTDADSALRADYFAHELPRPRRNALVHEYPQRELRAPIPPAAAAAAPPPPPPPPPIEPSAPIEPPAPKRQRLAVGPGVVREIDASSLSSPPSHRRRSEPVGGGMGSGMGFASPPHHRPGSAARYLRQQAPPRRRTGGAGSGGASGGAHGASASRTGNMLISQ